MAGSTPPGSTTTYLPAVMDSPSLPANWPATPLPGCITSGPLFAQTEVETIGTCDVGARGFFYTPPQVRWRHCSQQLNFFYPDQPSGFDTPPTAIDPDHATENGLYKVLMYSPTWAFSETSTSTPQAMPLADIPPPQPFSLHPGFLHMMLDEGWVVVTVGSVGSDSPSFFTHGGSDYGEHLDHGPNVFFEYGTDEWESMDRFWGEKDFTWARQFVAQHAAELMLDNEHVYVTGRSSGALYAAHVALSPERTTESVEIMQRNADGSPYPNEAAPETVPCTIGPDEQLRKPTEVEGIIILDPAGVWFPAYAASNFPWTHFPGNAEGDPAGDNNSPIADFGNIWPNPPYNLIDGELIYPDPPPATPPAPGTVSPAIAGSISYWVRQPGSHAASTKVLIVADEGIGTIPSSLNPEIFERYGDGNQPGVAPLFDLATGNPFTYLPLLTNIFPFGSVHTSWNGYTLWEDLLAVNANHHLEFSALYVRKEEQVDLFTDGLGPPFRGVTDPNDPNPRFPYEGERITSYLTGQDYAGHARSTYDEEDYGNSDAYNGITQFQVRHWLKPSMGVIFPLGCGYNPSRSLVVTSGQPTAGETFTVSLHNPIVEDPPTIAGLLPFPDVSANPEAQHYIQEMDAGVTNAFMLWSGLDPLSIPGTSCGLVLPTWGMHFIVGTDGPSHIVNQSNELVVGRGELLVPIPPNLTAIGVWGGPTAPISIPLSFGPGSVGGRIYLQGMFLQSDPPHAPGYDWIGLTDALEIIIGI